jgi:hypothetical protein
MEDPWWTSQRGRGLYTRTVSLPLRSRLYVLAVLAQALVLIGVNTAISVLTADCPSTLMLTLGSLTTLFMGYFAIEAVRTENKYQLAAYAVVSAVFLTGYLPPLCNGEDGPKHALSHHDQEVRKEVYTLIYVALVSTCTLQLCAPHSPFATPAPRGHPHAAGRMRPSHGRIMRGPERASARTARRRPRCCRRSDC